jgi:ribosomal protein S18 acetylase RimI-like enzyme
MPRSWVSPEKRRKLQTREMDVAEQQTIAEVPHASPAYWATIALRDQVLRKPLGLCYAAEELQAEKDSRHIACYRAGRLVGCLVLRPQGDDARMRQVAVIEDLQRRGIGKALVEYSEALARGLGFRRMVLHAREMAVPFYERLGYVKLGERYEEVTIPHWSMEKRL